MKKYLLLFAHLLLGFIPSSAQWTIVGQPDFADSSYYGGTRADYIFSAVAPNGDPYVIYRANIDIATISAGRVMKFNGSNWILVGSSSFSAGDVDCTTMAFDKYGTPYIAFMDGGKNNKATVMKFDGANWVSVGSPGF